jgi:hypothetical protein
VDPGQSKADPSLIIRAHWGTYVDGRTGRPRLADYAEAVFPPAVTVAFCLFQHVKLDDGASAALLTVSGLLGAFLFGVMLQVYERSYELEDSKPEPGETLSIQVRNLEELAANAAYAALVCMTAAGAFAVATATSGEWLGAFSALGLGLTTHYAVVLLMVMRRLFIRTKASLQRATTGSGRRGAERPRGRRERDAA